MSPVNPGTTKLDPTAAWPFGAVDLQTEAEQLAEFLRNSEEAPL